MRKIVKQLHELWNDFWRDNEGRIVAWQTPNFPLIMWALFLVLSKAFSGSHAQTGLAFLSTAFLFTWSYMEIISGQSYFRRLLGTVVIFGIIITHFR